MFGFGYGDDFVAKPQNKTKNAFSSLLNTTQKARKGDAVVDWSTRSGFLNPDGSLRDDLTADQYYEISTGGLGIGSNDVHRQAIQDANSYLTQFVQAPEDPPQDTGSRLGFGWDNPAALPPASTPEDTNTGGENTGGRNTGERFGFGWDNPDALPTGNTSDETNTGEDTNTGGEDTEGGDTGSDTTDDSGLTAEQIADFGNAIDEYYADLRAEYELAEDYAPSTYYGAVNTVPIQDGDRPDYGQPDVFARFDFSGLSRPSAYGLSVQHAPGHVPAWRRG